MKTALMLQKLEALPNSLLPYSDRNSGTLWQVVKAYQANQRQGTVGVKTRAMVKSTGKKPYKQKKTGNARRGSFVAPLHVGGGVAHGPKARDYREATPKKMLKTALGVALASRIKLGTVFIGDLNIQDAKTKTASQLLKTAVNTRNESTLVCLYNPTAETVRAFRNLRNVLLVSPQQLNALHILQTKNLIATKESFQILEARVLATQGE